MGTCLGRCLAGKNNLRYSTADDQQENLVQAESTDQENIVYKIMKFKRKTRPQFLDKFLQTKDLSYSRLNQNTTVRNSDIQLQCLDAQTLMLAARDIQNSKYMSLNNEVGVRSPSRASSSLDLEWEHEYGNSNGPRQSWVVLPEEVNITCNDDEEGAESDLHSSTSNINLNTVNAKKRPIKNYHSNTCIKDTDNIPLRTVSRTSWSHTSTPESLEWDIDEDQQTQLRVEDDSLDVETLELLHEIEMLKNKVLNETGDGLDINLPNNLES